MHRGNIFSMIDLFKQQKNSANKVRIKFKIPLPTNIFYGTRPPSIVSQDNNHHRVSPTRAL